MYLSPSEIKQLNLLKKKTPAERFELMLQLIAGQLEAMKAGIKYRNTNMSEKEVEECFKVRLKEIYSWEHKKQK